MPWLDTFQMEERYHFARATLAKLRVSGGGPPYIKAGAGRGAKVLYDEADVVAWLAAKGKRRSTSDPGTAENAGAPGASARGRSEASSAA